MDTVIDKLSEIEAAAQAITDEANVRKKAFAQEMDQKTKAFDAELEQETSVSWPSRRRIRTPWSGR